MLKYKHRLLVEMKMRCFTVAQTAKKVPFTNYFPQNPQNKKALSNDYFTQLRPLVLPNCLTVYNGVFRLHQRAITFQPLSLYHSLKWPPRLSTVLLSFSYAHLTYLVLLLTLTRWSTVLIIFIFNTIIVRLCSVLFIFCMSFTLYVSIPLYIVCTKHLSV